MCVNVSIRIVEKRICSAHIRIEQRVKIYDLWAKYIRIVPLTLLVLFIDGLGSVGFNYLRSAANSRDK